ncbi:MAG: hypothetical protein GY722_03940 [bacterium]|nr:hypothetical protein [bacterium]
MTCDTYTDAVAAVRRARNARNAVAGDLYRAQLHGLAVDNARRREARGEGGIDPAAAPPLRRLRTERQTADGRQKAVTRQLEALSGVDADITRLKNSLAKAPKAAKELNGLIAEIGSALETASTTQDRKQLPSRLQALQARRVALANATAKDREELAKLEQYRKKVDADALRHEVDSLEATISDLERAIETEMERSRDLDLDAAHSETQRAIDSARRLKGQREADLRVAIETLYDGRMPDELIECWDDALPIMLLPLRIETRWQVNPGRHEAPQLRVRVYPDDVGITNHEPVLTEPEVNHGQHYWTAFRAAAGNTEDEASAWNALARRFGGNRAAWVARQTQPVNWEAALADTELLLDFAEQTTKPDPWTVAPHCRVLPERFVLLAWRGEELRLNVVGNPIDDVMVLGPAPVEGAVGEASLGHEPMDRTLRFGEAFRWVRDFDDAVARGMAFRVNVSAEDVAQGFDRLLVLGLKLSADAQDAQSMVEGLIDNHHYSNDGFELLAQGTPTNNTDGNDSGYTRDGETGVAGAGPARFTPTADRSSATDGQRFADFLGIDYAPMLYADGSDHADHVEAVAMNRALYAGTLGYYLDHMLDEAMDENAVGALRQHFTDRVTGRGPIAAIRIGDQPYGVLATSSLARWRPSTRKVDDNRMAIPHDPFEMTLLHVLEVFDEAWMTLLPGVVQLGSSEDPSASLLKVLGLHPTSAEFYHRVGYSFDYLRNLDAFAWDGENFDDTLKMIFEGLAARSVLGRLGYESRRDDGTAKPHPLLLQLIWRHYQTRLNPLQLIDGLPLSEAETIKPFNASGETYLDWLYTHAADGDALEAQDFAGAERPTALLYMLLQFALVMEGSRAIFGWLGDRDVDAHELIRSRKFMNVTGVTPSVWEVFRAPANRIVKAEASTEPLYSLMHTPQLANGVGLRVNEQRAALARIRGLPTARLERALVEHIDTLTYRLDAWETSLFARRLEQQRRMHEPVAERGMGLYLGAYGYLENVRRGDAIRTRVDEPVPDDVVPEGASSGLHRQAGNGGYVHTPSLNHATAAALLRNGYLTYATPDDPDALAVNLSSGRVERAKALLEGIQKGQSLETQLGVQFERALHDWTTRPVNPVILNQLKPLFRTHFPILRTHVPQANDATHGAEIREDYSVVNGLTLAKTTDPFPWGIPELSSLSTAQQKALRGEKAAIAHTLDALRDLMTAESAYQLALGNFDRAAAVLQSVGNGTAPPDIEVINTPRGSGISFTQRLAVQFDTRIVASPWAATQSPRAELDPPLNAWLGDLLGTPDTIACRVAAIDVEGAVLSDGGGPIEGTVTLANLDLQPIDFVLLVRSQTEPSGAAELETRVRYRFVRDRSLPDDTIVRITFGDAGSNPALRSFAEVLPLADRMRKLLGTARSLDASHFQSASNDAPGDPDNLGRIDRAELRTRVNTRVAAVRALFGGLQTATDAARTSTIAAVIDALRDTLVDIARAGFPYAMPQSAFGSDAAQRDILVQQADELLARAEALGPATDDQLASAAAATRAEQGVEDLKGAVRAWMGSDVPLLPRFMFGDPPVIAQADAQRDQLLKHAQNSAGVPLPMEEWLHGVACVRSLVHDFEMLRAMADANRDDPLPLAPLQLPFRIGDSWLATEYPSDMEVVHDTVSIVQHLPQGFDAALPQCGLLIDDWTESVPSREEVTGLCFNFNAPNSAPPQALLLAVTPHETGSWSWDDLVDSVLDTFRRAKLRAVEPDAIGSLPGIGTLLPAVVAEFSTSAASVSLDYALMVAEIKEFLAATMATPLEED